MVRGEDPPAWLRQRWSVLKQRGSAALQQAWGTASPAASKGLRTIKHASKKTFDRLRATPWQTMVYRHWKLLLGIVAVILLTGLLISVSLIVWKVPQWQAATWEGRMEAKDLAKLENDTRSALIQAIGGAVLLLGFFATAIGLVLTWRNLQLTQDTVFRNLQLTQDRQITEQYTRAIEQLGAVDQEGKKILEVRLGAIYALERIARDSERDHWPIMEILTTYVREHAPWEGEREQNNQLPWGVRPKLAADIQAILTVIGRRTRTYEKGEDQPLNLTSTDLRGAYLWGAHLEGAFLSKSCLDRANLAGAHLEGVSLREAHLEGVELDHADLTGANLYGAYLTNASIYNTCLAGTNLQRITAEGFLQITPEQLSTLPRGSLFKARLDLGLQQSIQQHYPHLFEVFSSFTVEDV